MQLVILAGGYGTRISEETSDKPKPMIKIGEYPIIVHIMKYYSKYGVNDFIICLGYKGYQIKEYFYNYNRHVNDLSLNFQDSSAKYLNSRNEKWNIKLVETGINTMTGGRLKRVEKYINQENFFLTYGDGLSNVDINKLKNFHLKNKKIATVTAVKLPSRFGYLKIKNTGLVSRFSEKPNDNEDWINGGFFVFNKKVFKYLKNNKTILERDPLEKLSKKSNLVAFKHSGFWYAMDTLRDKKYLEKIWSSKNAPWK